MRLYPLYSNQILLTSSAVQHASLKLGTANLKSGALFELAEDAANAELVISCYHDTEATTPLITLRKADGTEASPALVDDNAVLGTIHFDAYDGSGWHTGAKIEARIKGAPSDGTDVPTEITFWTCPDASATLVQRMTILESGYVGIGTTTPDRPLEVSREGSDTIILIACYHDTEATSPILRFRKADGSEASASQVDDNAVLGTIEFMGMDGTDYHIGAKIQARIDGAVSDGTDFPSELTFWTTADASGTPAQRMAIKPDGKVGMHCSSPAGALSIGNVTEGKTASINIQTAHETHTLTLGASSVTTGLDIPTTALVLGAAFCVNTTVADSTGDDTWSAAFSGGDASAIVAAAAAAQNTKVHSTVVPALTNAETEITFTPQGGNFTAGIIEVVAYYIDLTDLANV